MDKDNDICAEGLRNHGPIGITQIRFGRIGPHVFMISGKISMARLELAVNLCCAKILSR